TGIYKLLRLLRHAREEGEAPKAETANPECASAGDAHKSEKKRERLFAGEHASHPRYHHPTCINPRYIAVKPKDRSEARKHCMEKGLVVYASLGEDKFRLSPAHIYTRVPWCTFR